jgi:hypothetical protein
MDNGPVAGHIAAENPENQDSYENRHNKVRMYMNQAEKSHVSCRHDTPHLIRPVAALIDSVAVQGDVVNFANYLHAEKYLRCRFWLILA